jgi:hypothetical protein
MEQAPKGWVLEQAAAGWEAGEQGREDTVCALHVEPRSRIKEASPATGEHALNAEVK